MAGLSRAPLFLLALALALALTASPAAGATAGRPRLVGGLAEADVNEEGVQQALNFALSEYNKASNDAFHSRAMRVVRARKQLVAGLNYFLDVEIGRTTCTKSQPNLASCPFHVQPHLRKGSALLFPGIHCPLVGQDLLGEVQLPGRIEEM